MKVGNLAIYRIAVWAHDLLFRLKGGIRGVDAHHVPNRGGAIIASVHLSHLDPGALACTMRHRRLLAMAKEELWKSRLFGWLIQNIGAHPVKRGEGDTESLRWCMSVLEAGQTLLVFPEGTRGDGETLLPIQRGVGMLAKKTGVPVVPVGIHGTQVIMPRGGKFGAKHPVTVVYGEPFTWEQVATGRNDRENREIFAKEIERRVLEACRQAGLSLNPPPAEAPPSKTLGPAHRTQDVGVAEQQAEPERA